MKTGDPHLNAVVPHVGKIEALTEKFFPSIFAVRSGGIGGFL